MYNREDICGVLFEENGEIETCVLPSHSSPGHCSKNYDVELDEEDYMYDESDPYNHHILRYEYS